MDIKIGKNKIKVVDDFLNDEDFNNLVKLNINTHPVKDFNIYHNEINENGILKSTIDKTIITKIHKNYHHKAIQILKDLNEEKVKLYDYSDLTIIVTNKNSKFPIHDDTPNKLLSGVIYISPQSNKGTSFFEDKKGRNEKYINWKPNRAVFFSRKERETWHSYEGDNLNHRIVLVYNLMTNKIREVYKVEKKIIILEILDGKLILIYLDILKRIFNNAF